MNFSFANCADVWTFLDRPLVVHLTYDYLLDTNR